MKEYLQYLVWLLIFAIVIEMVFPDNAYRKYIKLVLGCILIYTMLKPVVGLIKVNGQNYESYVKAYQAALGQEDGKNSYEEALRLQEESLKKMYEESITAYVEKQFEVSVTYIQLDWQAHQLSGITLTVGKKEDIAIGRIQIGDKSQTVDGDTELLKNKIKTSLSDFYNVQVGNIYITVQKN